MWRENEQHVSRTYGLNWLWDIMATFTVHFTLGLGPASAVRPLRLRPALRHLRGLRGRPLRRRERPDRPLAVQPGGHGRRDRPRDAGEAGVGIEVDAARGQGDPHRAQAGRLLLHRLSGGRLGMYGK